MLVTRHQWLAKSTENISAECEASPSSTKTFCSDEHPQLSQMPHRGKKGTRNFQHHFSISITAYQITDNKELKYHHVFISYGGFSAHCSVRFSVILFNFFCQLRHNTQSIHYDFQLFTASFTMPSFDPTRTDDDDWRHVCWDVFRCTMLGGRWWMC